MQKHRIGVNHRLPLLLAAVVISPALVLDATEETNRLPWLSLRQRFSGRPPGFNIDCVVMDRALTALAVGATEPANLHSGAGDLIAVLRLINAGGLDNVADVWSVTLVMVRRTVVQTWILIRM